MDHQKNFIKIRPRKGAHESKMRVCMFYCVRASLLLLRTHVCTDLQKNICGGQLISSASSFFVVKCNAAALRPRIPQIQTAVLQVKKCGV